MPSLSDPSGVNDCSTDSSRQRSLHLASSLAFDSQGSIQIGRPQKHLCYQMSFLWLLCGTPILYPVWTLYVKHSQQGCRSGPMTQKGLPSFLPMHFFLIGHPITFIASSDNIVLPACAAIIAADSHGLPNEVLGAITWASDCTACSYLPLGFGCSSKWSLGCVTCMA